MRWGANRTLPYAERLEIEATHASKFEEWFRWLAGYDNFPFSNVGVNVVGWAVKDKALLPGPTDHLDVYTDFVDDEGFPTCDPGCSRDEHPDGDYSGCPGGADRRFHQFLLFDPISFGDFNMGAATGYGIYISLFGWENVGRVKEHWPMLVHEMVCTCSVPMQLE